MTALRVRTYGTEGPLIVVLHGGPGAAGHMAPVARGLAGSFRVLEPFQRASGGEPLTVARHIADLHELIEGEAAGGRPALVGSSWGAMLALAYAAAHPASAGPLVLIGCGTFDPVARAQLQTTLAERMGPAVRERLAALSSQIGDPDERLKAMADLVMPVYSWDPVSEESEDEVYDGRGHDETWNDMLRLESEGVYPAAFAVILSPVLMLHGAFDPHPGRLILASLERYVPQIEYREWEHCGHYPWREKAVRDEFFRVLQGWLARTAYRG